MGTELAMKVEFTPRGAAAALFAATDDEVLIAGPAGTGKSVGCLWRMHMACLLNPGMRGLIVRKTLASLGSTALVTWREKVVREAVKSKQVSYYGGSSEEPPQYRYANGSLVMICGMDKPSRIMSSEYDLIYVQEAVELTETDWESLTTRLRNGKRKVQQIIADTNPAQPTHWLKKRVNRGTTRELVSRHEDNPLLYTEDGKRTEFGETYTKRLDNLTGIRKARLRYGQWVGVEGTIYDQWDDAIHLVDRFDIPVEWPRYWVIDFGFTNPFVCQWWAENPDGALIMYREIYMTRRLVEAHAKTIMDQVSKPIKNYVHPAGERQRAHHGRVWTEPRPRSIICDHDAEGRATLEVEVGLSSKGAHKAVIDGIQAVQSRLNVGDNGKARLYIMRDSLVERDAELTLMLKPTCTVEEIPGYIWDTTDGKPPKETPVKQDDHGCDTTRYVVADRDLAGQPNLRFF
jgi:phage terminase large subunit